MKNFYLPLPEAERVPVPTTALARTAIDWKDQARKARQVAVAEYAIEVAGTGSDLDQDLESAGIEHLLKPTSPVTMKRAEVYWVGLVPRSGSEQPDGVR